MGRDVSHGLLGRPFIEWRTASARPKIVKETNKQPALVASAGQGEAELVELRILGQSQK
jgi:hypothetical protein